MDEIKKSYSKPKSLTMYIGLTVHTNERSCRFAFQLSSATKFTFRRPRQVVHSCHVHILFARWHWYLQQAHVNDWKIFQIIMNEIIEVILSLRLATIKWPGLVVFHCVCVAEWLVCLVYCVHGRQPISSICLLYAFTWKNYLVYNMV